MTALMACILASFLPCEYELQINFIQILPETQFSITKFAIISTLGTKKDMPFRTLQHATDGSKSSKQREICHGQLCSHKELTWGSLFLPRVLISLY